MKLPVALGLSPILFLAGCTRDAPTVVTPTEYAALRTGMSYAQVVQTFGAGAGSCGNAGVSALFTGAGSSACTWKDTNRTTTVVIFNNDKAISWRRDSQSTRRRSNARRWKKIFS